MFSLGMGHPAAPFQNSAILTRHSLFVYRNLKKAEEGRGDGNARQGSFPREKGASLFPFDSGKAKFIVLLITGSSTHTALFYLNPRSSVTWPHRS